MKKDFHLITIHYTGTIKEAMEKLDLSGVRSVLVVDDKNKLLGIVTDGDIRKAILDGIALHNPIEGIMTKDPKTTKKDTPKEEALKIMKEMSILSLPVVHDDGTAIDLILLSELMSIPLSRQDITNKEIEILNEVITSPYLSLGPKVVEFEKAVADYVGAKYAVAVNSGTSGLHLAVRALDIKDGDEVITTPFSFIASANCALFERAKPV